jgi:GxxExxY protein
LRQSWIDEVEPRSHEEHEAVVVGRALIQSGAQKMAYGETTSPEIERVATEIVDAAFKIHQKLGAGLLESAYRVVMIYELKKRGLIVRYEVPVPVVYEEVRLEAGYRLDLVVNECVVVELKSVEKLVPLHDAQLLTYLKLTGFRLGLLINFNTKLIRDGIKRIVL